MLYWLTSVHQINSHGYVYFMAVLDRCPILHCIVCPSQLTLYSLSDLCKLTYISNTIQCIASGVVSMFTNTVEPLSNDHPHQRPSLLYDHILCDRQWFLFVRSLTNDHLSNATNDRVRWDFLPRERPPRLQCISKNRGWLFNIRSQSCIITMLCLDTFQFI